MYEVSQQPLAKLVPSSTAGVYNFGNWAGREVGFVLLLGDLLRNYLITFSVGAADIGSRNLFH